MNGAPIHGDLEQSRRTRTLDGFREWKLAFSLSIGMWRRAVWIFECEPCVQLRRPQPCRAIMSRGIGRNGPCLASLLNHACQHRVNRKNLPMSSVCCDRGSRLANHWTVVIIPAKRR